MNVVFLFGPPGVGKLTVAKELHKLTGYKLFHNHLTVDLVTSVFDFGSLPYIELRHIIWIAMFERAKREGVDGLIFTFAPESSVPDHFIPDLVELIEDGTGEMFFVELTCSADHLRKRIADPSRRRYNKGISPDDIEKYYHREHLIPGSIHERKFLLDNSNLPASDAAKEIARYYNLPMTSSD